MSIIFNADDFGKSLDVNAGIVECFKIKLISQTSVMVNMPCFDNATMVSKKNNFFTNVGLHINLTEGVPLTEHIKNTRFCNNSGEFNKSLSQKKFHNLFLSRSEKSAIYTEIEAQMIKYCSCGYTYKRIDSHNHVHTIPSVLNIVIELARKYNFHSIRYSRNIPKERLKWYARVYKLFINHSISRFNKNTSIKYFGIKADLGLIKQKQTDNCDVEIMIHPTIKNGEPFDIYENYFLSELTIN